MRWYIVWSYGPMGNDGLDYEGFVRTSTLWVTDTLYLQESVVYSK